MRRELSGFGRCHEIKLVAMEEGSPAWSMYIDFFWLVLAEMRFLFVPPSFARTSYNREAFTVAGGELIKTYWCWETLSRICWVNPSRLRKKRSIDIPSI